MTKPVALADATYRRLRQRKRPGESFSQTVDRLMEAAPKDPMAFIAKVPRSRVPASKRLADIEAERDTSWEDA